jgi:hypothetical protein
MPPAPRPPRPPATLTHFLLSDLERTALEQISTDGTRVDGIRTLIAKERQRRNRKAFRPPPPAHHPIPDTGRGTPQTTCKLSADDIASLDEIARHMRDHEGIILDRNGVLRRLIHDERRRQLA